MLGQEEKKRGAKGWVLRVSDLERGVQGDVKRSRSSKQFFLINNFHFVSIIDASFFKKIFNGFSK